MHVPATSYKKYKTIVIDPPWEYPTGWPAWNNTTGEGRKPLDYPSLTTEQISTLPIFDLIAPEGYLFLWTTNRYLEQAFSIMRDWRCRPKQTLVWCKKPKGQGPGGMFATTTEFILLGQRIGPSTNARKKNTKGRINTSWFEWKRGKHSQKPEKFLDIIEKICLSPYLEMFARRQRIGWDVWGNEVESSIKFEWNEGKSG